MQDTELRAKEPAYFDKKDRQIDDRQIERQIDRQIDKYIDR